MHPKVRAYVIPTIVHVCNLVRTWYMVNQFVYCIMVLSSIIYSSMVLLNMYCIRMLSKICYTCLNTFVLMHKLNTIVYVKITCNDIMCAIIWYGL